MAQQLGVADLLVRCLEREGVTAVFGIPGEENIGFVDALARSPIRYVLVRHEQAASFMAEIYGRLTGRAGVCSATLGPGAINLLLGTADATTNSSPVVAISAQVGLNRIYKESHQSVDLVAMFAPVAKWADVVLTPGAVPEMVRKAFKLAQTERPGAVYLAVPEDVEAMGVREGLAPLNLNIPRPDEPSAAQIERAAAVLGGARQPVVLAGHGAARAGAAGALRRFSEQLGLPVATTFHGKGVFPDDHPHALGAVGFMRHDYVNFGFDEADVIVAVGYELQEFDPARINPGRDKRILHLAGSRPRLMPATTSRSVSMPTSARPWTPWLPPPPAGGSPGPAARRSARCWQASWRAALPMIASPSSPSGSCPTPGPPWGAPTSSWPTPGR